MSKQKFKVWDSAKKLWVTSLCAIDNDGDLLVFDDRFQRGFLRHCITHTTYKVLWSTGLCDKNGKEIYMVDKVQCFYSENLRDEGLYVGIVVWDNERTKFKIVELPPYKLGFAEIICFEDAIELEVIGHGNPELLEQSK